MPIYNQYLFFSLFVVSGFSGLIYESIWSHYLKLFLGHAAYAQTLVLAIFMGGMAIGAWISGHYSTRWRSLMLGYAVVELFIGVMAIIFHPTYLSVTEFTFSTFISGFAEAPLLVVAIKWGIAALLILPQSILLGMTFPLMVGGLIRRFPQDPGRMLATLYFTNSLGAVMGVLVSAFVLIPLVGLPGTILSAGIINISLALVVWALIKNHPQENIHTARAPTTVGRSEQLLPLVLMLIASFTGLSSFLYEIGWIRMLTLVLGGTSHSFELMLAAFILGLALGGLWIRNRIDQLANPQQFLGYVQIAMGLGALLSIVLYSYSFDLMSYFLTIVRHNAQSYPLFLLFGAMLAILIMLPATFCAGMTLPLITRLAIKGAQGEKGIGYIYAANTLGAIVGIFMAVHLLLPTIGMKNMIMVGAIIDFALGLYLIGLFAGSKVRSKWVVVIGLMVALLPALFIDLDLKQLTSGVFRYGAAASEMETIYYRDGKTSSVAMQESLQSGKRVLLNNGKPDASIMMLADGVRTKDEDTQILLGALPLMFVPEARSGAVIGLGSGMTTHTLLASPKLEYVDTIEIEEAVIDASRLFLPAVARTYDDPRSQLHVEDAKTFFSMHDKRYDIIISEPPNPWVSGVATLFSQEFYHRIKEHLTTGGIFVQWLHLYEIDMPLVAMVFNALGREFRDYSVFTSNQGDIVIVASADSAVPKISDQALGYSELMPLLSRIDINGPADLAIRALTDKRVLAPLFHLITPQVNSNFFPKLDVLAPKARYMRADARSLIFLKQSTVPILPFLNAAPQQYSAAEVSNNPHLTKVKKQRYSRLVRDLLLSTTGTVMTDDQQYQQAYNQAVLLRHGLFNCSVGDVVNASQSLWDLGLLTTPHLSRQELAPLWDYVANTPCFEMKQSDSELNQWLSLFAGVSKQAHQQIIDVGLDLLKSDTVLDQPDRQLYLLMMIILADVANGGGVEQSNRLWEEWHDFLAKESRHNMVLLHLLVLAGIK